MRTATDFNLFYATPDPWRLKRTPFRDRALRRQLRRFITDNDILELGCGEGHLTETLFADARSVIGIDISDTAIARAKARNLPNARFEAADFLRLQVSFAGFDVIVLLEVLHYLSFEEQCEFFAKVAREHRHKPLIVSAPIIGENGHRRYFTHAELLEMFRRHGFSVLEWHNIFPNQRTPAEIIAARLVRLPFCLPLLDLLPERFVYQRAYAVIRN